MTITQDQAFALLAARLEHARKEHPKFATSERHAADVVYAEYVEMWEAIDCEEGPARIVDEALDVAATAMRLVMGEVQG